MEYVVTTQDLTRNFGSFTAVNKLNIRIKRGEIYGFLGPNGSGKTTTIRMLCGILAPTSGSGTVLGYDLTREAEKIKQSIGYMSQKFSLYDDLTAFENLEFYAGMYSIPYRERKKRIAEMLELSPGEERTCGQPQAEVLNRGWPWVAPLFPGRPSCFWTNPPAGLAPSAGACFSRSFRDWPTMVSR